MSTVNDYKNAYNQQQLSNANSILNGAGKSGVSIIPGISGDLLQQWAMLGANSKAYKALQEAQKTGSVRNDNKYTELLSDKYFNDNYNPETKKYNATYTPVSKTTPEIDKDKTSGDVLSDMRTLALSAIGNPNSLNSTHYDFFEKMRSSIANNLVTKGSSSSSGADVTTEAATAASVSKEIDYRLLLDQQRFTVAGKDSEVTYSFGAGASLEEIVAAVNGDSDTTGVKAELVEGEGGKQTITFTSVKEGADQTVRIDQLQGDLFAAAGSSISGKGTDAVKGKGEEVANSDDTRAAMVAGIYTGKLFEDNEFTIQGRNGSETFTFEKGAPAEEIVSAINDATSKTGVTAEVIYGADGTAEGIGLAAEKTGSGNYVQISQAKGDLFAREGKSTSVAGSSAKSSDSDGPAITKLEDLGRVTLDGQTYSFADLIQGGKASLANNPDAALAVLDQAIKDIYDGRAEIKGFDPADAYIPGVVVNSGSKAATNTLSHNDYGSDAMKAWLKQYAVADEES